MYAAASPLGDNSHQRVWSKNNCAPCTAFVGIQLAMSDGDGGEEGVEEGRGGRGRGREEEGGETKGGEAEGEGGEKGEKKSEVNTLDATSHGIESAALTRLSTTLS